MHDVASFYDGANTLAMALGMAIGYVTGRIHAQTHQALKAAEEAKAIALQLLHEEKDHDAK